MAMNLFRKLTDKVLRGGKRAMKKKKPAKRSKPKKIAKKKTIKKIKKIKKIIKVKKITKIKKIKKRKPVKRPVKKPAKKSAKKPAVKIALKAKKIVPAPVQKELPKKELKLKKGPHTAYLGLGSNVGDREEYLEQAIFLLSKTPGIKVIKKSTNYETEPEGNTDQPQFMNAAVEIRTTLDPYKLLAVLQETENALGRERDVDWGPRTIDLDILLYDDLIISDDKLQVPHSLLHERLFVLKPLSEIAPNAVHPAMEKKIIDIYEERKNDVSEKYDDELPGFKNIKKGVADDYERW
jgi:2-amino-4-hydroxy-6-hydroxymethyldihydropteridine diphosphokinase